MVLQSIGVVCLLGSVVGIAAGVHVQSAARLATVSLGLAIVAMLLFQAGVVLR